MRAVAFAQSHTDFPPPELPRVMSDEDLLLEYRLTKGEDLFAELVNRYEGELFGYLQRYISDATLAEDVFQATFLQLHLKCDAFERGRTVRPWLYKIATNLAIDALRRRRRHRRLRVEWKGHDADADGSGTLLETLSGSEPIPAEQCERSEQRRWVKDAVDGLPEHLRRPILLVYFQGLKYREAAEVLSLPIGTLKSRMHAGLERLKSYSPAAAAAAARR